MNDVPPAAAGSGGTPEPGDTSGTAVRRIGRRRVVSGPASDPAPTTQSRDDTDVGWGERAEERSKSQNGRDEWLRNERPPHWA